MAPHKVGNLGIALDSQAPYGAKYVFHFGVYGWTHVFVWGADLSLEDALQVAAEWLRDHAPGIFTEPDYEDAAEELGEAHVRAWFTAPADRDDENETLCNEVVGAAETDLTHTESGHIASWEWNYTEDPSPEYLRELAGMPLHVRAA